MTASALRIGSFALGLLVAVNGLAEPPAERPINKQSLDAALRTTRAAAAEYDIRVGEGGTAPPLELKAEPVFRWSNPVVGDIHGNVFLWTHDARPLVVGSLFHWFSSRPTMEHEFHSLTEQPLAARFHGELVWTTREAGVRVMDVPKARQPAAGESQRFSQLKELAQEFTGFGVFGKSARDLQLRLLPQPIYRFTAPKHGVLTGGLFAFVRATDPEIMLLIEARGSNTTASWKFAAIRMHSTAELRLQHGDQEVWKAEPLMLKYVYEEHQRAYTAFKFKDIPEFLNDASID